MQRFEHSYPFDPSYGYDLEGLLRVEPDPEPADYAAFWRQRYTHALSIEPRPSLRPSSYQREGYCTYDLAYESTDGFPIRGWLLRPLSQPPSRGFILGHGYGGIQRPDFELPQPDAIYCVPCFRGLGRSARSPISTDPQWHVLHDVQLRDRYLLGGCVEDVWTSVSALFQLFPELAEHLGYMGISFGGGIGAMAMAWDSRIRRGHLNVPSFGHQALRMSLPTIGSAASVQRILQENGHLIENLRYYDSALAARHIRQPMHIAAALFDPVVAPPGQFAVYNALPGERHLFVLDAGHFEYPGRERQERELLAELATFFEPL